MRIESTVPYIFIKEVWTEHEHSFYQTECEWLLTNLAGRLRKVSWRRMQTEAAELLLLLFQTDWFTSVKVGSGGAIILERRRGHIFFVIRLEDIVQIKRFGINRELRKQHKQPAKNPVQPGFLYATILVCKLKIW